MSSSFPIVLIVDDAPAILDIVPRYLVQSGIKAEVVASAQDALEKVNAHDHVHAEDHYYDAIIVDINMPKMNGIVLSQVIREKFPIIMMTGKKTEDLGHEIADLCDCFVEKNRLKSALAPAIFKAIERFRGITHIAS